MRSRAEDPAKRAYEAMARFYDDFTSGYGYQYEKWSRTLLAKAQELGASGERLLDVACGTGLSFAVPLERGWRVTACDISPAMIAAARAKAGDRAELLVADMRELPRLGEFDLIWALNNPIGYLGGVEELTATLAGMRRNLAPRGLAVFDATTLEVFRSFLGEKLTVEREGRTYVFEGRLESQEVGPGAVGEGRFEVRGEPAATHFHRMRHFGQAEASAAIEAAGLTLLGAFGEVDSRLEPGIDEDRHTAAVYFCRA
ncbi:MAG TPA: class I SAM-dependent methyltransferase [Solirubrobacterales bacterium]|nr:class I SAM-dependent methyltransferase [Solirubrobacterales bacterium]